MSENPAPQNPDQPSSTPPEKPSKVDWRSAVIVGIAVLFLIAAYINKKWYSNKPNRRRQRRRRAPRRPRPSPARL